MNAQVIEAIFILFQRNRIIQILCIFGIDGHQQHLSEIGSCFIISRQEGFRNFICLP